MYKHKMWGRGGRLMEGSAAAEKVHCNEKTKAPIKLNCYILEALRESLNCIVSWLMSLMKYWHYGFLKSSKTDDVVWWMIWTQLVFFVIVRGRAAGGVRRCRVTGHGLVFTQRGVLQKHWRVTPARLWQWKRMINSRKSTWVKYAPEMCESELCKQNDLYSLTWSSMLRCSATGAGNCSRNVIQAFSGQEATPWTLSNDRCGLKTYMLKSSHSCSFMMDVCCNRLPLSSLTCHARDSEGST